MGLETRSRRRLKLWKKKMRARKRKVGRLDSSKHFGAV